MNYYFISNDLFLSFICQPYIPKVAGLTKFHQKLIQNKSTQLP